MPTMLDFGGEDNFASLLIDDRKTCLFRSGINFELKIRRLNVRDLSLQDDCERRATKYGSFAPRKKLARHRRMTRRKRLFVGVQDSDFQINELNFRW
jgi:hypothetical protein